MIEQIGRPGTIAVADDTIRARAASSLRINPPIARCHPERPMYRVGLCQHCYAEVQRDSRRTAHTRGDLAGLPLSGREIEALRAAAAGLTNKEVGERIGCTEQTVKNHHYSLRRKLGALTIAHAVAIAAGRGLLTSDDAPPDPWASYFEAVERNVDRLRSDLNAVTAKLREARQLRAEPEPAPLPRFAGDPLRIVPTAKGARRVADHCRKGHPFTEANTRITPKGSRACRTCHAEYARNRYRNLVDAARRAA